MPAVGSDGSLEHDQDDDAALLQAPTSDTMRSHGYRRTVATQPGGVATAAVAAADGERGGASRRNGAATPGTAVAAEPATVSDTTRFGAPKFSPLYAQIQALITASLSSGDWKPGESIPSEGYLAKRYGVSQGTVRKAIDAMAADNLLVRRQGKGTFVATHAEARAQFRFLRLAPDDDRDEASTSRILSCRRIRAPADIARHLGLRAGDGVVAIRRVLSFDGVPTVLDDIWLNGTVFRGLTAERIAAHPGPLYGLFESEFATPMTRADEKIRAVAAEAEPAAILGVPLAAPLLSVERVSMTYGDRPVELRRGLYSTTSHHYRNTLG
jgi:GntR family transcriptional regulator